MRVVLRFRNTPHLMLYHLLQQEILYALIRLG